MWDQGIRFLGSSLIVDAFGECRAGPMGEDEDGVLTAEMDLAQIRAARVRSPRVRPREDRRTDVYDVAARVSQS
jgi:predicted amidohydrolase